ncbi:hypothetical protein GCM10010124_03520 [Pilimelia terevasa]|uniref:Nudix hydrolase domain-containing protein n=1 Tax=Pilimelia terevasa TaxID=53372 RepID=A0A8J3FEI4_9ACTN|nr:NUDIX domain-containing protein [Pilimelia terevasa]GGK14246.1 hypothetical protein GCM10010124_03520 [Pilimelia terevasa]
MERLRRIAAYGVCRDDRGRVLLVRRPGADVRVLPGADLRHGEDPRDAVVRGLAAQAGLAVAVTGLAGVASSVTAGDGVAVHVDGIAYRVCAPPAPGGGPAPAGLCWYDDEALAGAPVDRHARSLLGLEPPAAAPRYSGGLAEARPRAGGRGQRFSAYALATDPRGRVLLTRNAPGYPYAGRWHLPGGGTDFGEQPAAAVLRELTEETGQDGRVTALLDVRHRHTPRAHGPEGRALDWHVVQVLYRVAVDAPTPAHVRDRGGSTAEARWWDRPQLAGLPLTPAAEAGLAGWR